LTPPSIDCPRSSSLCALLLSRHAATSKYKLMMKHWKVFTEEEIAEREIFMVQAMEMWRIMILRKKLYQWKVVVATIVMDREEAIARYVKSASDDACLVAFVTS
jgi:hypothetical protein